MILLLLGTNPYPFDRLMNAVIKWTQFSGEHVIAQTGHTLKPENNEYIECHDFIAHKQIMSWIDSSEFVICQGGFGSLRDCIVSNKPVIAVPRYQELNECQDSQKELVVELAEEGCVIPLYDIEKFTEAVDIVRNFSPEFRKRSAIPELVADIIHNIYNQKN